MAHEAALETHALERIIQSAWFHYSIRRYLRPTWGMTRIGETKGMREERLLALVRELN
jgi:hypothetical protein